MSVAVSPALFVRSFGRFIRMIIVVRTSVRNLLNWKLYSTTLDVNLNCRVISENKFSIRFDKKPPEPRKCTTCTNRSIGCMQLLCKRTECFFLCVGCRKCEENVETLNKNCSFLPFDWFRTYHLDPSSRHCGWLLCEVNIVNNKAVYLFYVVVFFVLLVLLLRVQAMLFVCASNRLYIIVNCSIKATTKKREKEEPITRNIITKTQREKMKCSRIQKWSTMRYGWVPMLNNNI